jgi:chemotaxis protein CheY-P-specific phosphatase CheC
MLDNLNQAELEVASKLVFDGMSMAKKSMEQILQSPISMVKVDYSDKITDALPRYAKEPEQSLHIIKTDLMGELKGTSHLIFTEDEVSKIYRACLPAKIIESSSPESEVMKIGFLTEVDNMMAAAVITEFSNFLGLEIYGMVPSLDVIGSSQINTFLEQQTQDFDSIIHFKANFKGQEIDISPDFIWVFHEEFMNKIKDII